MKITDSKYIFKFEDNIRNSNEIVELKFNIFSTRKENRH